MNVFPKASDVALWASLSAATQQVELLRDKDDPAGEELVSTLNFCLRIKCFFYTCALLWSFNNKEEQENKRRPNMHNQPVQGAI